MDSTFRAALVVIDVQRAFDDPAWGTRNNPDAEQHVALLLNVWRQAGRPVFHIRHCNRETGGRFHPDSPGYLFKAQAQPEPNEPVLTKHVNSAFIGTDLEHCLHASGVDEIVVCGLTTDHCVSTTVRMAANLGFRTSLVADATATFDRVGPDGRRWSAELMHDAAIASLYNEFASITQTAEFEATAG